MRQSVKLNNLNKRMEIGTITAQSIFDNNASSIKLTWLCAHDGANRSFLPEVISKATSGADLVGHVNLIHPNRIQVFGQEELDYYARFNEAKRRLHFGELIALNSPFLVVADDGLVLDDLLLYCTCSSTPLFSTPLSAAAVIDHLRLYLSRILAPRTTMHGVFLDILGIGVMLVGASGIGKSELGLELISRGHGLVADDSVELYKFSSDHVEGRCPSLLQNLLEVRGLGLLDIKAIFGETAVRRKMNLNLVIELIRRNEDEYPRLPFESQFFHILGLPIDKVTLQVAAGRNLAVLVEAAVRNTILRFRGIDTLKDFMVKQYQAMQEPSTESSS